MKIHTHKSASVVLAILLLTGCASKMDKKIDSMLAKEPDNLTTRTLASEAVTAEEEISDLSKEQKALIDDLKVNTGKQIGALKQVSIKLRSLLIKNVLSTDTDLSEQQALMNRIRSTENKRMSVMFDAVGKANNILGHNALQHRLLVERMFFDRERE